MPYETLDGEHGLEDGFPFLRDVTALTPPVASPVQLRARAGDGRQLDVFAAASTPVSWWRAIAPGAPGSPARAFVILRTRAVAGWIRMVWSWRAAVTRVRFPDGLIVERSDGATHTHARRGAGWRVEIETAGARHTIDLPRGVDPRASDDRGGSGIVEAPPRRVDVPPGATVRLQVVAAGTPPIHYQWRLNGIWLMSASEDRLPSRRGLRRTHSTTRSRTSTGTGFNSTSLAAATRRDGSLYRKMSTTAGDRFAPEA